MPNPQRLVINFNFWSSYQYSIGGTKYGANLIVSHLIKTHLSPIYSLAVVLTFCLGFGNPEVKATKFQIQKIFGGRNVGKKPIERILSIARNYVFNVVVLDSNVPVPSSKENLML